MNGRYDSPKKILKLKLANVAPGQRLPENRALP